MILINGSDRIIRKALFYADVSDAKIGLRPGLRCATTEDEAKKNIKIEYFHGQVLLKMLTIELDGLYHRTLPKSIYQTDR